LTARINGANVALGSGGGSGITIGTTTITSGTNTRVLYNNAGVVGEYVITGTGNVVMSASPTLTGTVAMAAATASGTIVQTSASSAAFESGPNGSTNPVYRVVSGASFVNGISITGSATGATSANAVDIAAIGSDTSIPIKLTPKGSTSSIPVFANYFYAPKLVIGGGGTAATSASVWFDAPAGFVRSGSSIQFQWMSSSDAFSGSNDLILRRNAAANLAFGATDAASPVAQTLSVQNVVGGTTNTAGVNWTFAASRGTGTGAGGDIIFQTAPAGGSGTTQNTLATAFTIQDNGAVQLKSVTFANLPTVANGYLIYCSDCTIASPCASGGSGALAKGINGAWVCN
jgi:hypothetical protein